MLKTVLEYPYSWYMQTKNQHNKTAYVIFSCVLLKTKHLHIYTAREGHPLRKTWSVSVYLKQYISIHIKKITHLHNVSLRYLHKIGDFVHVIASGLASYIEESLQFDQLTFNCFLWFSFLVLLFLFLFF